MNTLKGKVVLVTGGSKGIGASVSKHLAKAGAQVIVNFATGTEAAAQTVTDIVVDGGEAVAVQADVSKVADVKRLFDKAIETYGKVDVLVNSAGVMIVKPLKETSEEEFDHQFDINIKGTFNTLREAAGRLSDNGSIINLSSTTNRVMLPGYAAYSATKSAIEQITRVFAKEVGDRGINVNSISPGPTNTELFTRGKSEEVMDRLKAMSPFNRLGEPEDIAPLVVFLASDEAKWISAQNIGINGAFA